LIQVIIQRRVETGGVIPQNYFWDYDMPDKVRKGCCHVFRHEIAATFSPSWAQ